MIQPTYSLGSTEATDALESLKGGVLGAGIVIGIDGYVKFANDAAGRIFGLDQEEMTDHQFADVFGLFEKLHEIVTDTVMIRFGVKKQVTIECPSGVTRSLSVTTSYLTDASSGAPGGVLVVISE